MKYNMDSRISIITLGVRDMRTSIRFYRDGLGFSTDAKDDAGWAIFRTVGTRFALFPRDKLAEDIGIANDGYGFGGITLAYNVPNQADVGNIIQQAVSAGGRLLKSPCKAGWGGYSGYFADPDGYPWEVAWGEGWEYDENGTLWGELLGPMPSPNKTDAGDA
jgi:catechol 2,3-dioxygenase-like lactoylglutathione lyase family enzyme